MAETQSKKSEALCIAEADSRDCDDCHGDGMVMVYDGSQIRRDKLDRPFVDRVIAHCCCPLGRFVRASWPEDLRRRTPDLIDVLDRRSRWSAVDPTAERVDNPGRTVTKEDFDAFWQMVANLSVAKDVENVAGSRRTVWSMQTDYRKRLARELDLDERVADVLTIDQLLGIKEART